MSTPDATRRLADAGLSVDDPALEAVRGASVICVSTDDGKRRKLPEYSRRAAVTLAAAVDARIVLVDRSGESWTVTEPGRGPLDRAAVTELGPDYGYLAEQIDEAAEQGVTATAWLTAEPPFQGLDEVIRKYPEVDAIVAPDRPVRFSLGDRARYLWYRRDIHARIREIVAPRPVLVSHEDGRITLSSE